MSEQYTDLSLSGNLELAISSIANPNGPNTGLPNPCYTDPGFARAEREYVFDRNWSCIGFAKDAPNPGDLAPIDFLGRPFLIARDRQHQVRVFHNACRHRGMVLAEKASKGNAVIRCPYHSWCYDLNGKLKRTPYIGGPGDDKHPDFDPDQYGLIEIRSTVWMGMIFVNLSGDAAPFEKVNADIIERWSEFRDAPLFHAGDETSTLVFELETNWKLPVENFCEAYHLPWVHPSLNTYSRIEDHDSIVEWGRFSGQISYVYQPQLSSDGRTFPKHKGPNNEGLSSHWDTRGEYIALYPNVLLGIHSDHFFAVLVTPKGQERTVERMELFYYDEKVTGADYADLLVSNHRTWATVFSEDVFAVEGMQKGRHSDGFDGGIFTPVMDPPTQCFHRWIAAQFPKPRHDAMAAAE